MVSAKKDPGVKLKDETYQREAFHFSHKYDIIHTTNYVSWRYKMLEKIKGLLNDVISIADSCPEKYQIKCFEILLNASLAIEGVAPASAGAIVPSRTPQFEFFTRHNIGEEEWQRVFHFDGSSYSLIVSSLKEKSVSKKQVKLALLLGAKALLETGEGNLEKAQLVELCKQHAVYDSANFATHMRRNKNLFLPRGNNWILTKPGEGQAAEVIKELSQ